MYKKDSTFKVLFSCFEIQLKIQDLSLYYSTAHLMSEKASDLSYIPTYCYIQSKYISTENDFTKYAVTPNHICFYSFRQSSVFFVMLWSDKDDGLNEGWMMLSKMSHR